MKTDNIKWHGNNFEKEKLELFANRLFSELLKENDLTTTTTMMMMMAMMMMAMMMIYLFFESPDAPI